MEPRATPWIGDVPRAWPISARNQYGPTRLQSNTTHLVLLACQVPHFQRILPHRLPIIINDRFQQSIPLIDEFRRVLSCGAEIDKLELQVIVQETVRALHTNRMRAAGIYLLSFFVP